MRRVAALLVVAGGVLGLDQWTKHLATANLSGRPPLEVLGDFVRLTYALNSGVAFSLGAGTRFPFYVFSIAAALVILWLLARGRISRLSQQLALALILGGALGNLVDRITSGLVVDFIEIGVGRFRWPVFNVADSAVSIGVVLFILTGAPGSRPADAATPETPADAPALGTLDDSSHPDALGDAGPGGAAAGPLPRDGSGGSVA